MKYTSSRAIALGLALAVATAALVAYGNYGALPFALWLVSIAIVGLALGDPDGRPRRLDTLDLGIVALLLALSAFLRMHKIDILPSGLWEDEVDTVRNAFRISTHHFAPFGMTPLRRANWVKTSNLYLYYCWLVLAATGFKLIGVKLISVLPGVAAPALLYGLARRSLSRTSATLTAGLLATSLWQVTLSRWGWDEVLVTALAILAFAALWDGAETGSLRSHWIAGAIVGLSLYTYLSSRLLAAAALLFLLWRLVSLRRARERTGLGAFLLGLGLVALPLAIYWLHDPEAFIVRIRQLWYIGGTGGPWLAPLARNVAAHVLMFHVAGDVNPRHNLPGTPMLDPAAGGLFLVGLAALVARKHRLAAEICFFWLAVGLLGGILSDPADAPQAYRTGFIAPACYLLAGIGFEALRQMPFETARWRRFLAPACAALLVAGSSVLTFRQYFGAREQCLECWNSVNTGARAELAREQMNLETAAGENVWLDRSVAWPALQLEVDRLSLGHPAGTWIRWASAPQLQPADLQGAVLLVTPDAWEHLPRALRDLPSQRVRNPFGETVLVALSAQPAVLAGRM